MPGEDADEGEAEEDVGVDEELVEGSAEAGDGEGDEPEEEEVEDGAG